MIDKLTTNELKNLCDSLLRDFLIKKAIKNSFGNIYCPLTKRWWSHDKLHVCHIIDRGKMSTRFNPANVFLGSSYSNLFESKIMVKGYQSLHHKKIEDEFGRDIIDFLEEQSKERKVYSREEYYDLIDFYKREIDNGEHKQPKYSEVEY